MSLAQLARESVSASLGKASELQGDECDGIQIVDDLIEIVIGTQPHTHRFTSTQELGLATPPGRERDDDGAGWLRALCVGELAVRRMPPLALADTSIVNDLHKPAP